MVRLALAGAILSLSALIAVADPAQRPTPASPFRVAAVDRGQVIARSLCADCHAIERGRAASPNAEAPSFQAIAKTAGMNRTALIVFLRTPHRMMPNLVLDGDDANDIIDYILSLAN